MADRSGIEWTDATWNPVTGCTSVSEGCDNCYARTFAERFRGTPGHYFERGFDVQLRPDKLLLPLCWRGSRKVFVNSMSDLFHRDVPEEYIARVFAVMAATPWHTYQVLTKRHARMRALLSDPGFEDLVIEHWDNLREEHSHRAADRTGWGWYPLPNVWLGVSVETQRWAEIRIPELLDTPAAVRFLSCEPLLGPVDLSRWLDQQVFKSMEELFTAAEAGAPVLDWVIVGGESGRGARPMHPAWARSLRDQCRAASVSFLFKQWGAWSDIDARDHSLVDHVTDDDRCQIVDITGRLRGRPWLGWQVQDSTLAAMRRYSKHAAGRVLDGRTWNQFPSIGGDQP